MRARARGFLLLPVTLTLVLVGALTYAMTRDADANLAAVDAAYDTETARYLAEAAFQLARWRNSQLACKGVVLFAPTELYRYDLALDKVGTTSADLVGTMKVGSIVDIKGNGDKEKGYIAVEASSATARKPAGSQRIVRTVPRFDFNPAKLVTLAVASGTSATIHTAAPPADPVHYLELTDSGANQSHALLRFDLDKIPAKALVMNARLELERDGGESWPLLFRKLELHRVTRPWDAATAAWSSPAWSKPGGDYAEQGVDSSHQLVDGLYTPYIAGNGIYAWHIDTLVAGWVDGTLPNYGVLLKPTRLVKSRFRTFASSVGQVPQLTVTYFPPCP